jgi:hypothetical protein
MSIRSAPHGLDKLIKFYVSADTELPNFYNTASGHYRGLALRLGAEAVTYIQKKALDTVRQETHAEAIQQATEEFEQQMKEEAAKAGAQAAKLRAQLQKAEDALHVAQARCEALEAAGATTRVQLQKDVEASYAALLSAKDAQIAQLQDFSDKHIGGLTAKFDALQSAMTKTAASSKEKGSFGEAFMENLLKRSYDCDVYQVGKERETGDIRMTRYPGTPREAVYFWEVKNYTRMVSTEEVNKFKRDLGLHPTVQGGVFVSLRQGIVGHMRPGDIDVEILEDGRPILYLTNFMAREDPVYYLQTLRPFFDAVEALRPAVKEDSDALRAARYNAALIANLLKSHADTVTKHRNALVGHRRRTEAMFAEFQSYIQEAETQLGSMLRVALGSDAEVAQVTAAEGTELPAVVFRKERLSLFSDERQREFITWLLDAAEVQAAAHIEVKELLERARAAAGHFSEKFVRGLREEVFQDAAWGKGTRTIFGLAWRSGAQATQAAQAAQPAKLADDAAE